LFIAGTTAKVVANVNTMNVDGLVNHLRNQRLIVDYTFVAAVALFIYDYLLTLHLEIKLVWLSQWTYTKVLFLLIRYMAFTGAFLFMINQVFLDVPTELCKVTWPVATWLVIVQSFFSQAVLSIRTWAVWNRNKAVGIGLVTLTIVQVISQSILTNDFVSTMDLAPPPIPEYRGCFVSASSKNIWKNYVVGTTVEAVVLTLMIISAFRSYRLGNVGKLSHIIYRDGVLFYIYLLCLPIANLAATLALPVELMSLLIPLQDMLYAVFTTRVVLNIREETTKQGPQTELHTSK